VGFLRITTVLFFSAGLLTGTALAQHDDLESDEPPVSVNGSLTLQTGVFVPLISDGFKPLKNEAFVDPQPGPEPQTCDPVQNPTGGCKPKSHGKDPGSMSMGRGTLQIEGDWFATQDVTLHAIMRAVRSMALEADEWAQPPVPFEREMGVRADADLRREANMEWVRDELYNEFEFRELYVDAYPYDWLALRLGRQQIAWGDLGQYRLLDVINPSDNTWHFGPLESFEDTRIPLWMAKGLIDIPSIDHNLELVWAPLFFDDPEDTVTVPLTFPGAWGLPYSNTPAGSFVNYKVFLYPGGELEDMRAGARWKGSIGTSFTYSLVYYYTHQLSPPVNVYMDFDPSVSGVYKFYLDFPRQHIAGFSFDYAFESPIGTVIKVEAAVEPERYYPTDTTVYSTDPDISSRRLFEEGKETAVTYAIQLFRPTMIRFLNPTQNFLLVAQFMHSFIPTLTKEDEKLLVDVPGFNRMAVEPNSYTIVLVASTDYFHGLLKPSLVGAWLPMDNGFYSINLAFRFGEAWRMVVSATDFIGKDPYKSIGLFKDRDEVNLRLQLLF
jgi:hypothetical protein